MHHIHLAESLSTQEEVKKALKLGPGPFLVSTDHQSAGVGRQGSQWIQFQDALAFSFSLKPNEELTLTPLEIGILLAKFFSPKVLLKWPNDLLNNNNEKIGGILCQLVGNTVVVGIGINLKLPPGNHSFPYPVAGLFPPSESMEENIKKDLPLKIAKYIFENRLSAAQVQKDFFNFCVHKNKEVFIKGTNESHQGKFIGITKNGAAILEDTNKNTQEILSGSLSFDRS